MKGLGVTKIFKEIRFEVIWGKLKPKNCLQRQSANLYLVFLILYEQLQLLKQSYLGSNLLYLCGKSFNTKFGPQ